MSGGFTFYGYLISKDIISCFLHNQRSVVAVVAFGIFCKSAPDGEFCSVFAVVNFGKRFDFAVFDLVGRPEVNAVLSADRINDNVGIFDHCDVDVGLHPQLLFAVFVGDVVRISGNVAVLVLHFFDRGEFIDEIFFCGISVRAVGRAFGNGTGRNKLVRFVGGIAVERSFAFR